MRNRWEFAFLLIFLAGCAEVKTSEMFPDFGRRAPPKVDLSQVVTLLEHSSTLVTSLVGSDGYVHVFALNQSGDIHHIVLSDTQVINHELIGAAMELVVSKSWPTGLASIDTIEHPLGTLRVAVKGMQYVQRGSKAIWQKVENSRCSRYLANKERLFCAYIAKGDEIGTHTRKDTTVLLLVILPVWSSMEKRSDKLVLAEEIDGAWHIRAIVDPEEPFDIDPDFFAGIDAKGTINLLYAGSRRGGFGAIVGAGGPGFAGGAVAIGWPSSVRFAQIPIGNLSELSVAANSVGELVKTSQKLAMIEGVQVAAKPLIKDRYGVDRENWPDLRRFSQQFSLHAASGEIHGLMFADNLILDDGKRRLRIGGAYNLEPTWVSLALRDGQWLNHYDVVTSSDSPPGLSWDYRSEGYTRSDPQGRLHLLLIAKMEEKSYRISCEITYLTNSGSGWSAPLLLGGCPLSSMGYPAGEAGRSLAFAEDGSVFATWIDKVGSLVGRFLSPIVERQ
jgi:hypothetical protein